MKNDPKDVLWRGQPLAEVEAPELRKAVIHLLDRNEELRANQRSPMSRARDLRVPAPAVPLTAVGNSNRWTSTDTLIFSCGLLCGGILVGVIGLPVLGW